MKELSFFETILLISEAAILFFFIGLFTMKVKIERLEKELLECHSETLREIQDNVALTKTIKELIH